MLKVLDLFSGIGGFPLAGKMVGGFETVAFCEIDKFAQKVLRKNFPGTPIYDDIRTLTIESLRDAGIGEIDCITGGFPCQDLSVANARGRGLAGKRSGLFYELVRLVRECRPRYIVLENVANLLDKHEGREMGTVLWELYRIGYAAEWQTISAASVGSPHLRKRVYIIAYPDEDRRYDGGSDGGERYLQSYQERDVAAIQRKRTRWFSGFGEIRAADANSLSRAGSGWEHWGQIKPTICGDDDGVSFGLDEDRVKVLGNAVVPQCAAIALQRVK